MTDENEDYSEYEQLLDEMKAQREPRSSEESSVRLEKNEPREWLLRQLAEIVQFLEEIEDTWDRQILADYVHELRRMVRALADCNCGVASECKFICKYKTDDILNEKKSESQKPSDYRFGITIGSHTLKFK